MHGVNDNHHQLSLAKDGSNKTEAVMLSCVNAGLSH